MLERVSRQIDRLWEGAVGNASTLQNGTSARICVRATAAVARAASVCSVVTVAA